MTKAGTKAKSSKSKPARNPGPPAMTGEPPDAGNMDKIRDILFGNQMRDVDKRFSLMEDQLGQQLAALKDEMQKQLEAFEVYFKKEIGTLKDRLKGESEERSEADEKLMSEIKGTAAAVSKKISGVEDNLAERATDLQEQILEQSKKLSTEIQKKYDRAAKDLKQAAQALDDSKVGRAVLAEFWIEMAMRLSGDQSLQSLTDPEK